MDPVTEHVNVQETTLQETTLQENHSEDVTSDDANETIDVPLEPESKTESKTESKSESSTEPKPKRQRVSKYTEILKAKFGQELERQGDVFVAPLEKPLHILSPTVTLSGDLYDADGELNNYVDLKLKRSHVETFAGLEELLLATAKNCKAEWFNHPDILDEFLETSLRRFFDKETRLLTVRLDEGLGGKKGVVKGTKVKVVLQADGAIFTRTQYGFLWKMTMIRSIEKNEDMYLFDPEEDPAADGLATGDLLSHVGQDDDPVDEFLN